MVVSNKFSVIGQKCMDDLIDVGDFSHCCISYRQASSLEAEITAMVDLGDQAMEGFVHQH